MKDSPTMGNPTWRKDQQHNDDLSREHRSVIFTEARTGQVIMINAIGVLIASSSKTRRLIPWSSVLELNYQADDEKMTATMLKLGR